MTPRLTRMADSHASDARDWNRDTVRFLYALGDLRRDSGAGRSCGFLTRRPANGAWRAVRQSHTKLRQLLWQPVCRRQPLSP